MDSTKVASEKDVDKTQENRKTVSSFFKPIQNWNKILKMPAGSYSDFASR